MKSNREYRSQLLLPELANLEQHLMGLGFKHCSYFLDELAANPGMDICSGGARWSSAACRYLWGLACEMLRDGGRIVEQLDDELLALVGLVGKRGTFLPNEGLFERELTALQFDIEEGFVRSSQAQNKASALHFIMIRAVLLPLRKLLSKEGPDCYLVKIQAAISITVYLMDQLVTKFESNHMLVFFKNKVKGRPLEQPGMAEGTDTEQHTRACSILWQVQESCWQSIVKARHILS